MSVVFFLITIVGLAFIVWMARKLIQLARYSQNNSEEPSPSEQSPENVEAPSSTAGVANAKNPDGRHLFNAMLFMGQQYNTSCPASAPGSMRRGSTRNGTNVRVRSSGSPHRVVPASRVAYHRPRHGRPHLLPMGENTVQIEVPIVVVLPPLSSRDRRPTTMLYDDPPPPFDEEPPPPYEEIFGDHKFTLPTAASSSFTNNRYAL